MERLNNAKTDFASYHILFPLTGLPTWSPLSICTRAEIDCTNRVENMGKREWGLKAIVAVRKTGRNLASVRKQAQGAKIIESEIIINLMDKIHL